MPPKPLPRDFYFDDTVSVARALLGCVVWHRSGDELLAARLVETEAYLGANDMASHARLGRRNNRNESMYLAGGHAYVYLSYGVHWLLNVVTQEAGIAEAVLVRAAEPVKGVEFMWKRRPKAEREHELMNGPGKFAAAMSIHQGLDGVPLDSKVLWLTGRDQPVDEADIAASKRIGVENCADAAHWPLRFFLRGHRHVSAYRYER